MALYLCEKRIKGVFSSSTSIWAQVCSVPSGMIQPRARRGRYWHRHYSWIQPRRLVLSGSSRPMSSHSHRPGPLLVHEPTTLGWHLQVSAGVFGVMSTSESDEIKLERRWWVMVKDSNGPTMSLTVLSLPPGGAVLCSFHLHETGEHVQQQTLQVCILRAARSTHWRTFSTVHSVLYFHT